MTTSPSTERATALQPMGWFPSLLYFGMPALAFVLGFHVLMPALMGAMPAYYAYLIGIGVPLVGLLLASLVVLRLEGRPLTWDVVKTRFRLKPMDGKLWLLSLAVWIVGGLVGVGLVGQLSLALIKAGVMPLPDKLPRFLNPLAATAPEIAANPMLLYDEAVGGLRGNWLPAIALFITLFFNIVGEEFWWRGVVLPRQELAFGRRTWVVHGLMWAVFHIFKWWDVLNLVPITLGIAYVCSRHKNTTLGIVIHSFANGLALIPLILAALGVLG